MAKKYSNKAKKRIVAERRAGASYKELKQKYGIGGDHTIPNWETRCDLGFLDRPKLVSDYSDKFKNKVISEAQQSNDIQSVATKYGLSYTVVKNWCINNKIIDIDDSELELDDIFNDYEIDEGIQDNTTVVIDTGVDIKLRNKDRENKLLNEKYKRALSEIEELKVESKMVDTLSNNFTPKIIKSTPNIIKGSESAIVLQWSDWHIEETVHYHSVNGLNEFNLGIAEKRINCLMHDTGRMVDMIKVPYKTKKIIIHLGGDFITGDIHDDLMESNSLMPTEAIIEVQNRIAGAIDYILANTGLPIEIVSSTGNHGRMTKQQRISTELGHSLEQYMYYVLEQHYKSNKMVTFHAQRSYHTILDIYGTITRFHHGHFMRYGGGVGGPTIPINKAIAAWNRSIRADLDVFGHFHQSLIGKGFILNGCLIGYNPYAVSIKAEYEPPSQNLFVIDSKRGRTLYTPIILEDK